ncbi:MAG: rod shape-determining protein RodA [Bacteroidales bacterium]
MQRRINIWKNLDWVTVTIYLVMIFFGWINIYAAVYNEEASSILDTSERYGKQLIFIAAAIVLAFFIVVIDIRFYIFFSYVLYGLVIFSLVLVLLIGKEVNGARSWFEFGSFGLQPSEFAKITTALGLARFLSGKNRQLKQFNILFQALALIFAPALLIAMQPDMGSVLVYFALVLVLFREGLSPYLFVTGILAVILFITTLLVNNIYIYIALILISGMIFLFAEKNFLVTIKGFIVMALFAAIIYSISRWGFGKVNPELILIIAVIMSALSWAYYIYRYRVMTLLVLLAFLIGSMLFIFTVDYAFNNILQPHQRTRINIVLGIESDPFGTGYNLNQSKISIGSGGFSGKGFLNGTQTKYKFVPEQSTDFIFCTVGEEWGFIGSASVILLFTFLLIRLINIAERQRSSFSRIYGYSVVSIILFHFVINIGMTIGLVPVIGIPLPFFSYGGSSLWGFTILLFIFLRLDASRSEYLV